MRLILDLIGDWIALTLHYVPRLHGNDDLDYLVPERKPLNLHYSCHCEGGTTEAISLKTRGLLRRSFLTPRNDGSKLWVFVQSLFMAKFKGLAYTGLRDSSNIRAIRRSKERIHVDADEV